jgi:hypothetical protein
VRCPRRMTNVCVCHNMTVLFIAHQATLILSKIYNTFLSANEKIAEYWRMSLKKKNSIIEKDKRNIKFFQKA